MGILNQRQLWFHVLDLGFRVYCKFGVWNLGFRVYVLDLGFTGPGRRRMG